MSVDQVLWAYGGLFLTSFLGATLLPGGSELALAALVAYDPDHFLGAVLVATVGNTLGGLSSYLLGRLFQQRVSERAVERVKRYGGVLLVLSWVPLVGDALCVAAGMLKIPVLQAFIWMAIGKLARYLVIGGLSAQLL